MDIAFIIGVVAAFGALYAMITMEGASLSALFLPAPMILVLGSTIGVGIASHTLRDAIAAFGSLGRMVRGPRSTPAAVIPILVGYAEKARTDGLLRLEEELDSAPDDYTRRAVQALADGVDAEDLRTLMLDEIDSESARNRVSAKFFASLGGYAPTIGIVGTVVSLTHVLENLSKPDELGHMIAAAFVATLWGLLSANFIWNPIAGRLNRMVALEQERMTLVCEGILAIQAGSPPRLLEERLLAMTTSPPAKKKQPRADAAPAAEDAA